MGRQEFGMTEVNYGSKSHFQIKKSLCYFLVVLALAAIIVTALASHFGTKENLNSSGSSDEQKDTPEPEKTSSPAATSKTTPLSTESKVPATSAVPVTKATVTTRDVFMTTNSNEKPQTTGMQIPTDNSPQSSRLSSTVAATTEENIVTTAESTTESTSVTSTMPASTTPPLPNNTRLTRSHIPYWYKVTLQPYIYPDLDPEELLYKFTGSVRIFMATTNTTSRVTLHSHTLSIDNSSICLFEEFNETCSPPAAVEHDVRRQFLHLDFSSQLQQGCNYSLSMKFNGTHLHDALDGFYLSNYTENGVKKHLVVTQFQTTHARQAFPCFDEPSFKAVFETSLIRRENFTSISNTHITSNEARDDGWVQDNYAPTPKMSSYLNAYVVSEFVRVTCPRQAGNTTFYHWARPSYASFLNYSCEVSPLILESLENYTGLPHLVNHTDQIAVPDFSAGAMENWGLITYRETLLCEDPAYSTVLNRLGIAGVIAHELAHMWFGNLVTCEWWDNTFLNEAFASYFEWPPLMELFPDWKNEQRFQRDNLVIMRSDDNYNETQSIYVPGIEHQSELSKAFSSITYSKGAAVLRMFDKMLGTDNFREALRSYLKKYSFGNTQHDDLYRAIQEQLATSEYPWDPSSGTNFTHVANSWIEQKGHPLLRVKGTTKNFTLNQSVFLNVDNLDFQPSELWYIEAAYGNTLQLESNNFSTTWLYGTESAKAPLDDEQLLTLNLNARAFLRLQYDTEGWNKIINQLKTKHTMIPILNRGQLLDDAFRLARAGREDETLGMELSLYLQNETEYFPFFSALDPGYGGLIYIDRMLRGRQNYTSFISYMHKILEKPFGSISFIYEERPDLSPMLYKLLVTRAACYFQLPACVETMTKKFMEWNSMKQPYVLNADLRPYMYCQGVRSGYFSSVLEELHRVESEEDNRWMASESERLLDSLSCSSKPWQIELLLQRVLMDNQTTDRLLAALETEVGRQTTLKFLKRHWSEMPCERISAVRSIASWMKTEEDKKEILELKDAADMNTYCKDEKDAFDDIVQNIDENIQWLSTNERKISDWLECQHFPGQNARHNHNCWTPSRMQTRVTDMNVLYGLGSEWLRSRDRRF